MGPKRQQETRRVRGTWPVRRCCDPSMTKTVCGLQRLGVIALWSQPTRKLGPQSYSHKELISVNNLNKLTSRSTLRVYGKQHGPPCTWFCSCETQKNTGQPKPPTYTVVKIFKLCCLHLSKFINNRNGKLKCFLLYFILFTSWHFSGHQIRITREAFKMHIIYSQIKFLRKMRPRKGENIKILIYRSLTFSLTCFNTSITSQSSCKPLSR